MMAKLYAASFSAGLMLLMDSVSSPGLLVRPRPSRLELGGEFVDGDRLVAAAIFAVGSVRACQRWLEGGPAKAEFPDRLRVDVQRDDQRYGWYVCRTAFAADLYLAGRETQLQPERGSPITGQTHLERCWVSARANVVGEFDEDELELVDKVVFGSEPLPALTPSTEATSLSFPHAIGVNDDSAARAFGFAARAHARPDYEIAPVMLTWDRAVFVASTPPRDRIAFVFVPSPLLADFASQLDLGVLDESIASYLALAPGRRLLGRASASPRPGLYDHLAPRARLLVPERAARSAGWRARRLISGAIRRGPRGTAGFRSSVGGSGEHG
jgi:hypothetical protein